LTSVLTCPLVVGLGALDIGRSGEDGGSEVILSKRSSIRALTAAYQENISKNKGIELDCVTFWSDKSWPTTSCNWFRTFFTDIVAKSLLLRILSIWVLNWRICSSDSPMLADKLMKCDATSYEGIAFV
jgi:hypothetical protein